MATVAVAGPWDGSAFSNERNGLSNSYESEYKFEYPAKMSQRAKGRFWGRLDLRVIRGHISTSKYQKCLQKSKLDLEVILEFNNEIKFQELNQIRSKIGQE